MWSDFLKITQHRKKNEIPSPRLWAPILQKLYAWKHKLVSINTSLNEVYLSFKVIKIYKLPNQCSFGPIQCFSSTHVGCSSFPLSFQTQTSTRFKISWPTNSYLVLGCSTLGSEETNSNWW